MIERRSSLSGAAWVLVAALGAGALQAGPSGFSSRQFRANEEIARWMHAYDRIAWQAWEQVETEPRETVERLGPEWFCIRDRGRWQAVFGHYDAAADAFETILHYELDGEGVVSPPARPLSGELLVRYARALHLSLAATPEELDRRGLTANSYVRPVNHGIEVWLVPAQQEDGTLALGGEVRHVYDSSGLSRTHEEASFAGFRAVAPDPQLALDVDRRTREVPTAADLYFLLSFADYFGSVKLRTQCFVTTRVPDGGPEPTFKHVERPGGDCESESDRRSGKGKNS